MVLQTKDGEEYLAFRHDNSCLERWVMSYFYIIRNLIYYLLKMQRQGVQGANKRPSCWGWFWTKSYLWDRNQLSALLVTSWKASPPPAPPPEEAGEGCRLIPRGSGNGCEFIPQPSPSPPLWNCFLPLAGGQQIQKEPPAENHCSRLVDSGDFFSVN